MVYEKTYYKEYEIKNMKKIKKFKTKYFHKFLYFFTDK